MNEESIFAAALEKGKPAERAAYLDEACAGDPALRSEVEALLQSHQEAGSFLEQPALGPPAGTADEGDPGATRTELSGGDGDELSLDFLDPPQKAGALGRLGHYEVLEVVGRGGMGIVLKAFDEALHRVVAIKVMAPQLATSASARKRFMREAQAAAAVRDEHVIDIHAVEQGNGRPYLVMEYVNGLSLQERLDKSGPLELSEVLRIGMQTAVGLAKAHAQGLIHRDVKPANILLENGVQRVKLTDFGLARAVDDASLTQSGVVAGTPEYMAPEQARGEPVDHRADLFSLGSVLYAMCTGRPPFRASGSLAVLKRVSEDTPRPVREINPEVPAWLAKVIEKLHAKDPANRFSSAAEVAEVLGQHLAHLQQPASVPAPATPAEEGALQTGERGRMHRWATAAAVLLCLLGGLAVSEATGLTRVAEYVTTVLHIRTPDGTLVVEVDDPQVRVTVEGDGTELAITGAGPQEVRLRPGHYQVRASKDGKPVQEELITITRGGRRVVKVSREAPGAPPAARDIGRPATLQAHADIIWCVAVAPDGTLATASADKTVKLWKRQGDSWQHEKTLRGHRLGVRCVAFSPDGKMLATGSFDATIKLWNPATGQERATLRGHAETINSLVFAPDGATLASASLDRTVKLWDVKAGQEQATLRGHADWVLAVAYSGDGKTLASADRLSEKPGPGIIKLWNVASKKERATLRGHQGWVEAVAFAPNRDLLASASHDGSVRLWDAVTGQPRATLQGHKNPVLCVAFAPSGELLASAGYDETVRLWDPATGKEKAVLQGHHQPIRSVAFTPDGKTLVTADQSGVVRLWDVTGVRPEPRAGKLVCVQPRASLRANGDWVWSLAFAPGGRTLATGGNDQMLRLWDTEKVILKTSLNAHQGMVTAVAITPDAKTLATASNDRTVKLWDASSLKLRATLDKHAAPVEALAFSPDGRTLASASADRTVRLWGPATGAERATFRGQQGRVYCLAFSPDGERLAAGGEDGSLEVWHLAARQVLFILRRHTGCLRSVAFSPDGRLLATASEDGTVKLWETATRKPVASLGGHRHKVFCVAFSPDGKTLASAGGEWEWPRKPPDQPGEINLWDVAGRRELAVLDGHQGPVFRVVFSPDGKTLASASADGTAKLWDVSR